MDQTYYCANCMEKISVYQDVCPHCSFRNREYIPPSHALVPMTVLQGRYLIGKVLGAGGFGITYVARDLKVDKKVCIKEFFVRGSMYREGGTSEQVSLITDGNVSERLYYANMEKFEQEARILGRFDNVPGIVGVSDYFHENNTAYIVMEYLEGTTLKAYVQSHGGRMSWEELGSRLRPVFGSLQALHDQGVYHRDISPDNIMLLPNGSLKVFDFGGARIDTDGHGPSAMIIRKIGYSPIEQYSRGKQGPWTDVYAMAATLYFCLTGKPPADSTDRAGEIDSLEKFSSLNVQVPKHVEKAIYKGLEVKPDDRYHSMTEFESALFAEKGSSRHTSSSFSYERKAETQESASGRSSKRKGHKGLIAVLIAAVCVAAGIGAFLYFSSARKDAGEGGIGTKAVSTESQTGKETSAQTAADTPSSESAAKSSETMDSPAETAVSEAPAETAVSEKKETEAVRIIQSASDREKKEPESAQEPVSESAQEAVSESAQEDSSQAAVEILTETVPEKVPETVSEKESETASEKASGDETQEMSEALSSKKAEDLQETASEAVMEPASEKAPETTTQPVSEIVPETAAQPASEKESESAAQQASEIEPETTAQTASEKESESAAQPASEKESETAAQPASEIEPETTSETSSGQEAGSTEAVTEKVTEQVTEAVVVTDAIEYIGSYQVIPAEGLSIRRESGNYESSTDELVHSDEAQEYVISNGRFLYVDTVCEFRNEIWAHTNYYGIPGWFVWNAQALKIVSREDITTREGSILYLSAASPTVMMRDTPDLSSAFHMVANTGQSCELTAVKDGWVQAVVDGSTGWIEISELSLRVTNAIYQVNLMANADLLTAPEPGAGVLESVPAGSLVYVDIIQNGYGKTAFGEYTGWISMNLLDLIGDATIVTDAEQYPKPAETASSLPRDWTMNQLIDEHGTTSKMGQTGKQPKNNVPAVFGIPEWNRASVTGIYVKDNLDGRPENVVDLNTARAGGAALPGTAADLSAAQDGGVIGWMDEAGNLFIAGEGGVKAPADCSALFAYFEAATEIDLRGLHTENTTNFQYLCYHCGAAQVINMSGLNTAMATSFIKMFTACNSVQSLDLTSFDTSQVENFYYMFQDCDSLTSLDLTSFSAFSAVQFSGMFRGCDNLTEILLNPDRFDTTAAESMSAMFQDCGNLQRVDVTRFNMVNVRSTNNMFNGCRNLGFMQLNWTLPNVTQNEEEDSTSYGMFADCPLSSEYGEHGQAFFGDYSFREA